MINATPYVAFSGQAEDALNFYQSVFGGDLKIIPWDPNNPMAQGAKGVMHGQLVTTAGWHLMAADNPTASDAAAKEQRVTICVWGDDAAAMTKQFEALSEGGTVEMPLQQQEWGDMFGGLKDRFGVDWGFNVSPEGQA